MIPIWQKVSIQDAEAETSGVRDILTAFNAFGDSVLKLFSGMITLVNMRNKVISLTVKTNSFPMTIPVSFEPYRVDIVQARTVAGEPVGDMVQASWTYNNGNVVIDNIYGLTIGIAYNVKIVML